MLVATGLASAAAERRKASPLRSACFRARAHSAGNIRMCGADNGWHAPIGAPPPSSGASLHGFRQSSGARRAARTNRLIRALPEKSTRHERQAACSPD
jgi:hypothetical protein